MQWDNPPEDSFEKARRAFFETENATPAPSAPPDGMPDALNESSAGEKP